MSENPPPATEQPGEGRRALIGFVLGAVLGAVAGLFARRPRGAADPEEPPWGANSEI